MINIASQTIKHIWSPIFISLLIVIIFVSTLFYGVKIDKLSFASVKIEQLYIKLDKRLFVTIDKITIAKESQKSNSKEELLEIFNYYPYLSKFFDSIYINELHYTDEVISFAYNQDSFKLDSKYLMFDIGVTTRGSSELISKIHQLSFKDFNLNIKGDMVVDLINDTLHVEADFQTFNIEGGLRVDIKDMILNYEINTKEFDTLKPFMDRLCEVTGLSDDISDWIYRKITASSYELKTMQGKFNLKTNDFYPYEMRAAAITKGVIVGFESSVPPARVDKLLVELNNNQLLFHILTTGEYEGVDVSGTKVHIYDLLSPSGTGIVVDIKANTQLDQKVLNILKAYKIEVPVLQTSGATKSNVILDMKFLPFEIDAKGRFEIDNARLNIGGTPFFSKYGTVELDNLVVHFKDANLVFEDIFNVTTNGSLDTSTLKLNTMTKINTLHVKAEDKNLVEIKDEYAQVNLDFNNGVKVDIDKFDTTLHLEDNNNTITLSNLNDLYIYSPFLQQNGIMDGKSVIKTPDFANYSVTLDISQLDSMLYKNGQKLTTLNLKIDANPDKITASSPNFKYSQSKNLTTIDISSLDVVVSDSITNNSDDTTPLEIFGYNTNIILEKYKSTIPFRYFAASFSKDRFTFDSNLEKGTLSIFKKDDNFKLEADGITDVVMNKIANKQIFKGGEFNLQMGGTDQNFSGHLHFNNSNLAQLKSYNNLIAFINTIPSLIFMKNAGFNESGIEVKQADILFTKEGDIISFHNITLNGVSTDITGSGVVNITDETMHLNIRVKTLKALSDTLSKIPIVNYILLGDDQSLTTSIEISGSIDDPVVRTQVLQDTIAKPFDIIKKTILLPLNLFQ